MLKHCCSCIFPPNLCLPGQLGRGQHVPAPMRSAEDREPYSLCTLPIPLQTQRQRDGWTDTAVGAHFRQVQSRRHAQATAPRVCFETLQLLLHLRGRALVQHVGALRSSCTAFRLRALASPLITAHLTSISSKSSASSKYEELCLIPAENMRYIRQRGASVITRAYVQYCASVQAPAGGLAAAPG